MAACSAGAGSDVNNITSATSASKSATLLSDMSSTSDAQKPWQQRLLGKHLSRCRGCDGGAGDDNNEDNDNNHGENDSAGGNKDRKLPTMELTQDCEVLGLYFSFVDPAASCDDFTRNLVELYESVNKDAGGAGDQENGDTGNNKKIKKKKRLEVVHVLLWSNVQDVVDLDESFRSHVAELPWLAVPSDDYERKVYITSIYNTSNKKVAHMYVRIFATLCVTPRRRRCYTRISRYVQSSAGGYAHIYVRVYRISL